MIEKYYKDIVELDKKIILATIIDHKPNLVIQIIINTIRPNNFFTYMTM